MLFERESDSIKGNPKRFPFLNKEQKGQERMDKKKMRKVLQKLALLGIIASLSAFTLGGCQKTTESKETQTEVKSEAKADETKQEEETESTDKAENTEEAKDTDKAEEKTDETEEKTEEKAEEEKTVELEKTEHPTITSDGIRKLVLKRDGEEIFCLSKEPADYKMEFDYWEILNPYDETATVNTETMYKLFDVISGFDFSTTADVPEGTDTGVAGSTTTMQIDYTDNTDTSADADKTMTLLLGNEDDLGNRYVAIEGYENEVYKIPTSTLEAIYALNPFDYILKIPALVNIETVESVDIKTKDASYTMKIKDGKYYIGDKDVEKETFTTLYQALLNVMLDSNLDTPKAENEKEQVLNVVFHRTTKEAPEITLTYYTYDGNYDSAAVNGKERYLVKTTDVNNLIAQVKEAFK